MYIKNDYTTQKNFADKACKILCSQLMPWNKIFNEDFKIHATDCPQQYNLYNTVLIKRKV